ncbi:MAG: sigma-70 family RNA polymerase sigma factor [Verrucomicrobiota bacterium]
MSESTASNAFLTTRWTRVLAARGDSTVAGGALSELCAAYYAPVTAFLRRGGRDEDAARDTAHGFFEWVLSRDPFAAADRQRGRFRSYLLGSLKHYLSREREKQHSLKRGGQSPHLSLQENTGTSPGLELPDHATLPPDREFDRQWALHVLRRALEALEKEFTRTGETARFLLLKPFLTGEATHGGLSALAATEGWVESTARSHLHRLRLRFRQCVKREITPTLASGDETPDEMALLMNALTGA